MAYTILQWNINGFNPQKENLLLLINKLNPDMICLQETNNKIYQKPPLKNYNLYLKNRTDGSIASGGVAIYTTSAYKVDELHLNSTLECCAVTINHINKPTTVCNVYLPRSQAFTSSELIHLVNQLPEPFILLGDFNSHSFIWGSNKDDSRGKILEQVLDSTNVNILNDGSPTHLNNTYKTLSTIDLTICSSSIAHLWDWKTSDELFGSDHFPIIITKQGRDTAYETKCTPKWKLSEADFNKYKLIISTKINKMKLLHKNYTSITKKIEDLTELILQTAEITIPKSSNKSSKRPLPWWNQECQNARRIHKQAFIKFKRHPTTQNQIEYKKREL